MRSLSEEKHMRKKIVAASLFLVLIAGMTGYAVWLYSFRPTLQLPQVKVIQKETKAIPNDYIEIRGLALNPPRGTSEEHVFEKAEEAGANYIIMTQWIFADLSGEIAYLEPSEEKIIGSIGEAHTRGFKVWLNIRTPLKEILPSEEEGSLLFELNPEIFKGLSNEARNNFLRNLKPIILKWAEICEKQGVEIFTPIASGQLYLLLLNEEAFTWPNDLLPEVRKAYSGLLVQKIDLNPETQQLRRTGLTREVYNFEGWDYISTDVFGTCTEGKPIRTFDDWRNFIRDLLNFSLSLNERYKTKGVIFGPEIMVPESGESTLKAGTDFWGHGELTEEEMEAGKVELFKILFEETYEKIKGYSFFSWMPGFQITYFEVEAEKDGQKYHDRIIPGYQGEEPLNLIKCYYLKKYGSVKKFEF